MSEIKSLYKLGEEYESEALKLRMLIKSKREKLNLLEKNSDYNEAYEIKRELKILYTQHRDAVEIGGYLKKYYEPHEGKREIFSYK